MLVDFGDGESWCTLPVPSLRTARTHVHLSQKWKYRLYNWPLATDWSGFVRPYAFDGTLPCVRHEWAKIGALVLVRSLAHAGGAGCGRGGRRQVIRRV